MAQWRAVIAIFCLLLAGGPGQALADTVNAALDTPSLELLPHLQAVATDQPAVSIEVPGSAPGQKVLLPLQAKGTGPEYRWIVANLGNPASTAQDVVMVVPHQGFVGSGVFWPLPQGSRILGLVSVGGAEPQRLANFGADAFALRIEPGQVMTVAMEMQPGDVSGMRLWKRAAFEANSNSFAFFRGVIIGLATLVGTRRHIAVRGQNDCRLSLRGAVYLGLRWLHRPRGRLSSLGWCLVRGQRYAGAGNSSNH